MLQRFDARVNFIAKLKKAIAEKDRKLNELDYTIQTVSFNIERPKDDRRQQNKKSITIMLILYLDYKTTPGRFVERCNFIMFFF